MALGTLKTGSVEIPVEEFVTALGFDPTIIGITDVSLNQASKVTTVFIGTLPPA